LACNQQRRAIPSLRPLRSVAELDFLIFHAAELRAAHQLRLPSQGYLILAAAAFRSPSCTRLFLQ
jgi:hypothetical protein